MTASATLYAPGVRAGAGDLNSDGSIGAADILLLQRLLRGDDLLAINPELTPDSLLADVAPFDPATMVATPDGVVDAADLMVLMTQIRAGATAIAQKPGIPTLDAPPAPDNSDPIVITGVAASPGDLLELVVDGVVQQTKQLDSATADFTFEVYLDDGTHSYVVRALNAHGTGQSSEQYEASYDNKFINALCGFGIDRVNFTPGQNPVTVATVSAPAPIPGTGFSGTTVLTRGTCTNPIAYNVTGDDGVQLDYGERLVLMPGVILELSGDGEITIDTDPADVLGRQSQLIGLGVDGDRVTIRGNPGGSDAFDGIRVTGGSLVHMVYADILNGRQRLEGVERRPIRLGSIFSNTTDDASFPDNPNSLVLDHVFVGYRTFVGPGQSDGEGQWLGDGIEIGPASNVRIIDSAIVGGGPGVVSGARPTTGLYLFHDASARADEYDVLVERTSIFGMDEAVRSRIGQGSAQGSEVVQFVDSLFATNKIGVALDSGSRIGVVGSDFIGNCTGALIESASPIRIESSEITGNVTGVRFDGASVSGSQAEAPRIADSAIHSNGLSVLDGNNQPTPHPTAPPGTSVPTCATNTVGFFAGNIASLLTRGANTDGLLDLRSNDWGTTSIAEIQAEIFQSLLKPLAYDISGYVDDQGQIVGGDSLISVPLYDLSFEGTFGESYAPKRFFRPATNSNTTGDVATVSFNSVSTLGEDVTVAIYRERDYSKTAPGAPIAIGTIPKEMISTGTKQWQWNGLNSSGVLVEEDQYVAELSTVAGLSASPFYLKPADQAGNGSGLLIMSVDGPTSANSIRQDGLDFNIFQGEQTRAIIDVAQIDRPTRATGVAYLAPTDNLNNELSTAGNCYGEVYGPTAQPKVDGLFETILEPGSRSPAGVHSEIEFAWRDSAQGYAFVTNGGIDASGRPIDDRLDRYCVRARLGSGTGTTLALWEPFVTVEGSTPSVSGADVERNDSSTFVGAQARIRVEPFVIHRSYDQIVQFHLCLDQEANVKISILNAGFHDPTGPGAVKAVVVDDVFEPTNCAASGPLADDYHLIEWIDIDEPDDVNHTFTIETAAVIDLPSGDFPRATPSSIYRGMIDLRP